MKLGGRDLDHPGRLLEDLVRVMVRVRVRVGVRVRVRVRVSLSRTFGFLTSEPSLPGTKLTWLGLGLGLG